MSIDLYRARYLFESAHCAVVTSDAGAYLLGYFGAPRHEWNYLTTFDNEAVARRAFEAFDRAVTDLKRSLASPEERPALYS